MLNQESRVERVEFTACGPHARLSRQGLLDLVLLFVGALALALFTKWGLLDLGRFGLPAAAWWTAAAAAAVVVTGLFVRIFRRGENWALYLGATLVASMLTSLIGFAGSSAAGVAVALLPLAPAVLVILAFVRMVRQADELQRHILHRALAFAFTVAVSASMAWGVLEAAGLPRLRAVVWCALLVISFAVGLGIFSRRYE